MRKFIAIIVAIIILWVSAAMSGVVNFSLDYLMKKEEHINVFQHFLIIIARIAPLLLGMWLVKFSWRKITKKKIEIEEIKND